MQLGLVLLVNLEDTQQLLFSFLVSNGELAAVIKSILSELVEATLEEELQTFLQAAFCSGVQFFANVVLQTFLHAAI
jgi:hypothetical protein